MSQLFLFSEPLPGAHLPLYLGLVDSSLSLNLKLQGTPSQRNLPRPSRQKVFPSIQHNQASHSLSSMFPTLNQLSIYASTCLQMLCSLKPHSPVPRTGLGTQ